MELTPMNDAAYLDLLRDNPDAAMMKRPQSVTMIYHAEIGLTDTGFPLKADIYYKTRRPAKPRPAVLFAHDWASGKDPALAGDRQGCYFAMAHDFLFVSLYYRQPCHGRYPSALKDVRTCARWLRANAAEYGVDPQKIAAMGSSAGTQWAFLAAANNGKPDFEEPGLYDNFNGDIDLVLLNAAMCDFARDFADHDNARQIIGATFAERPDLYHLASPLENVRPGMPPVFMTHGDQDKSCPIESARALAAKLKAAGNRVELMVLPGRGHGSDGFQGDVYEKLEKMAEFAKNNL